MIYIKKIFNQDIHKQFAVTKDPSLYFFKQSLEKDTERNISFHYYSLNGEKTDEPITATIKGYDTECRINGDFKGFLEKNFKLEAGDIVAFKDGTKDEYLFTYIKKNEISNDIHRVFELFDDNHCLYDESNILSNNKTNSNPLSLNRIIFGAPGTGKSHKLEIESSLFEDTSVTKIDENELMKQEIYALGSDRSNSFAIGIKYFDKLKDKKIKDLQTEYNCNRHSAYAIYQAIRVYEKIGQLPDFGDEISDEKIKQELDEILKVKYMNQAGAAAIGFKYSDHLDGRTINELKEDFDFGEGGSLAHWLYYGVQAANYRFEKSEGKSIKKIERVTFHPNYSYAQFVGTYKPIKSKLNPEEITYEYVPGPFMRVYVNAKRNPEKNFLLLIEEINRANVAAVFGDVFQLLDRKNDGTSQYPISASEDQKNYLESCGINEDEIAIPANMYIWATMNSADQGVLPMDAAFKRRWDFEYLDVDNEDAVNQINDIEIPISRDGKKKVKWNDFRTQLNDKLSDIGVNEDKLLGPFFMSKKSLENAMANPEQFVELFESKVIMYLFEDVVKMQPGKLFTTGTRRYSRICKEFEEKGMELFGLDVEVTEV